MKTERSIEEICHNLDLSNAIVTGDWDVAIGIWTQSPKEVLTEFMERCPILTRIIKRHIEESN